MKLKLCMVAKSMQSRLELSIVIVWTTVMHNMLSITIVHAVKVMQNSLSKGWVARAPFFYTINAR